jgi:DNA-binding response OmpR family regulator
MRLLLVEDDPALAALLQADLRRNGFAVDCAGNGIDAEFQGDSEAYDAVILDLGLPQRPGLEVLKNWRGRGNRVPVIILTARDAWHERVDGLRAGADDYLGKPFHVEELLARLHAVLHRSRGQASGVLQIAGLRLNEAAGSVTDGSGAEIALTATEFRLLRYFMLHPGEVLSKTVLTEHIYDQDFDKDSNLIEAYLARLRRKLGANLFHTRRGQGYVFGDTCK